MWLVLLKSVPLFSRAAILLCCPIISCLGICCLGISCLGSVSEAQTRFASGLIVFPVVSPRISSSFGMRNHPIRGNQLHHQGIDLAAPEKSHVRAILDGQVVFAGVYAGYGKLVTIEHSGGRTTLYGHLSEILVGVGKKITAGDVIGRVGTTGISTGPHLHFEYLLNGQPINPIKVFPNLKVASKG